MRLRTVLPLALGLLAPACSGEPPEPPPADAAPAPSPDEQALSALREAWQQAYNSHEAAAVADLYVDSAWVLNADGSYDEGRAAVLASLESAMAASPTATVPPGETLIFGDMAVAMGGYSVRATGADSAVVSWAGTYLLAFTKASGAWKILGGISNYDSPRPEGWPYDVASGAPPDQGTMTDLLAAWRAHWDLGHADSLATLYTEDASIAFPDGPIVHGRAAIAADLADGMAQRPTRITLHDVETLPLGEEWALDGGWYDLTPNGGGAAVGAGSFLHLMRRGADGTWKIHWGVGNGYPPPAM